VAIDRAATLRHAEKLLRQGKLDAAIAAYASVVDAQPTDWTTANTLGDLYLRAGQPDRAAEQFSRSAERLRAEGFLAKAAALYKKILKLKPDDEGALLQAGEIAAQQGLFVDARAYFDALVDRRSARGDDAGAMDIRIRIGTLDPNDYERRIGAARMRADRGDTAAAVADLRTIAADLARKRRPTEAADALQLALRLAPDNRETRAQLVAALIEAGDLARARECATTVQELTALANALEAKGHHDEAVDTLRRLARLTPGDWELTLRLARAFVARGDAAAAAEFLTPDTARADPLLLVTAAELQLRSGQIEEGLTSVRHLLEVDAEGREQTALLSCRLAEQAPDAGFRALEIAVDEAGRRSNWPWAVAALQEFARRAPQFVPALLRIVEIGVDAGLDEAVYDAQVMLTDAYLAASAGAEARLIAEDLVDREPWESAHIDRLRRALVLVGERDPDGVIARRLSAPPAPPAASAAARPQADAVGVRRGTAAPAVAPTPPTRETDRPVDPQFALGPNAIDIDSILAELAEPNTSAPSGPASSPAAAPNDPNRSDVDLTVELNAMKPIKAPDLDGVFEQLRHEASRRSAAGPELTEYQRALALYRAGDLDGCIAPLQAAARAPDLQFGAALLLGRIFKERGVLGDAIEWFERAAEADGPTPAEVHEVLYELADTLESIDEPARALAVWLELQTDAGVYRDVAARIDRLARVKARG
jgi:tetratricopeptide (TPR) repeat protein